MKNNINELMIFLNKKNRKKRLLIFITSLFLSALSFNLFFEPKNLLNGGINSLSLLTKYLFQIDVSVMIWISSIILLIVCYIFLGKKMFRKTILGTILYAVFVKLTLPIAQSINIGNIDNVLTIIYGSLIVGLCNGFILKTGYSSGGFQVLYIICHKIFKISVGNANMIINGVLIFFSYFIFGINNTFYSILIIFISSFITDKVILGVSTSKNFYIITTKEKEIREYIINDIKNTFTMVDVKGGYSNKNKKMIVCAIPTIEYPRVKEIIKEIDKDAFFLITDTYELSKKSF